MSAPPSLRSCRRVILLGSVASLAGCGFALRRTPELPFATLALTGFAPGSELAAALRRQLSTTATRVVESPAQAQAVLEALEDVRERSVVATSAAGQVREMQLRQRLRWRLRDAQGRDLLAPTQVALSRDMTTSETDVLAKEKEEAFLYRAMANDIAAQVLRRLSAVRLP